MYSRPSLTISTLSVPSLSSAAQSNMSVTKGLGSAVPHASAIPGLSDLSSTVTHTALAQNNSLYGRNEGLAVIEVAISATILFLAVVGNTIVVVLLMVKPGKLSRMHLMMLHLSLADLFVAFFQVLPQMVWDITFRFQGGAFLCGAVKYLQLVAMYASAYVLVSTALDRYVAICKPFMSHNWTSRHAHLLVLAAWLAAFLFSLPQVFIFSLEEQGEGTGVYDCWATFHPAWTLKVYVTWNVVSVFLVPSMLLAVLYGHISRAVWTSSSVDQHLTPRYIPQRVPGEGGGDHEPALNARDQRNHRQTFTQRKTVRPFPYTADWDGVKNEQPLSTRTAVDPAVEDCQNGGHHQLPGSLPRDPGLNSNLGVLDRSPATLEATSERPRLHHHHQLSSTSPSAAFAPIATVPTEHSAQQSDVSDSVGIPVQAEACGATRTSLQGGVGDRLPNRGAAEHGPTRGISRTKVKTIKLTLTVVVCYLLCWTPFYVAMLWSTYDENADYESYFFTLVLLLASVNSCTNPWIYMAFSDTIWNSLRARVLRCVHCFHLRD